VTEKAATIFVCVKCRQGEALPGLGFLDAVRARLSEAEREIIAVEPVACLSVCTAPSTVALMGAGRWSYVLKGLEGEAHIDDLLAAARLYIAAEDGRVPKEGRPASFKSCLVARTPPQP
jgi:predicted metal-binding protein